MASLGRIQTFPQPPQALRPFKEAALSPSSLSQAVHAPTPPCPVAVSPCPLPGSLRKLEGGDSVLIITICDCLSAAKYSLTSSAFAKNTLAVKSNNFYIYPQTSGNVHQTLQGNLLPYSAPVQRHLQARTQ